MSAHCHDHDHPKPGEPLRPGLRRALWIALVVNALMFAIEIAAGLQTESVSLLADAIDFFGTGTAWPDLMVAFVMAGLAISAGWTVMRQARRELA